MEQMSHARSTRKKTTAKSSVTVSVIIHALIFLAGAYWAAHEGMRGQKMKDLSATIMDKEKKEVKKDEPKAEERKAAVAEEVKSIKAAAASTEKFVPPAAVADVAAAVPPPVIDGSFIINQAVIEDPVVSYKEQIETALRSKWQRPADVLDFGYFAEVEVSVDATGHLANTFWKKGSGDAKWDDSVKQALEKSKTFRRPPPKGFPERVLVRFDVQQETETTLQ